MFKIKKTILLTTLLIPTLYATEYKIIIGSNHLENNAVVISEYIAPNITVPELPDPSNYTSCSDLLLNVPATLSGMHSLTLNGNTLDVECVIDGSNAWTAITPEIAYVLNGGVVIENLDTPQIKGFENQRPYSASVTVNYNSYYEIPIGFNYSLFKLVDYKVKGAADKYSGNGTWDVGNAGTYTSWAYTPNGGWGDMAIGSPNDSVPSFSYATENGSSQTIISQEVSINTTKIFSTTSGNVIRIAWSQGGGEKEGLFPFYAGKILVK